MPPHPAPFFSPIFNPLTLQHILILPHRQYNIQRKSGSQKTNRKRYRHLLQSELRSLYPALKRLTAKRCLTTTEKPQGGRKIFFYHLTEKGQKQFFA
ncbi:PadR family transcriptional regulator [Eisenbergiella sp.]